jgi:hypothetical protein
LRPSGGDASVGRRESGDFGVAALVFFARIGGDVLFDRRLLRDSRVAPSGRVEGFAAAPHGMDGAAEVQWSCRGRSVV